MPKITDKPLKVIQVRIFEEDYERLKKLYGQDNGVNRALRAIIHSFLIHTEDKINDAIDKMEV